MSGNNYRQELLLKKCLGQIEIKMGWSAAGEWQSAHYDLLSDKIFEKTKIRLSSITLKRLWGRIKYSSSPSRSTLNALANFIGYTNWISYSQEQGSASGRKKARTFPALFSFLFTPFWKYSLLLSVGLVILAAIFSSLPKSQEKVYGSVEFNFEPVSSGLPNTVAFKYNVANTGADSVFIQQSWNPRLRHKVDINKNYFASTYYYPGYYKAKLILDTTIVREKDLYIVAPDWLGTIDHGKIPLYLDKESMLSVSGNIGVTEKNLNAKGIDLKAELPRVKIHLVRDFGEFAGDKLTLTSSFRNLGDDGIAVCQKMEVVLLGSEAPLIIPFSIKGCVGELKMYLAGESLSGKDTDLSGFGVDFTNWVKLSLVLSDKKLKIMVNETLAFERPLRYSMGKLVGVRYQFRGSGLIKFLEIDANDKTIFRSDF